MTHKKYIILLSSVLGAAVLFSHLSLNAGSESGILLTKESITQSDCKDNENCFFPSSSLMDNDIVVRGEVNWGDNKNLVLHTRGNIVFEENAKLSVKSDSSVILKAGLEPGIRETYTNTVRFEGSNTQVEMQGKGKVKIYYNPLEKETDEGYCKHKYCNPHVLPFYQHIKTDNSENIYTYMLVNDVNDLQNMVVFLSKSYALSQDIDAAETKNWDNGRGFKPLKDDSKNMPFSGNFDGNNYVIDYLFINRPAEDKVGLFGMCSGREHSHNIIENLWLRNVNIVGDHYVGSLIGWATYTDMSNVRLSRFSVSSKDISGGLIGAMYKVNIDPAAIILNSMDKLEAHEYKGYIAGSANESNIVVFLFHNLQSSKDQTTVTEKISVVGKENHTDISRAMFEGDVPLIKKDLFKILTQSKFFQ